MEILDLTETEKKNRHKIEELDILNDDICKMDIIQTFTGLKTLILISQNISRIEVSRANLGP
jgi:hypothetical protein